MTLCSLSLLVLLLFSCQEVECVVGGRKTKANKYPWLTYLEIVDHQGKDSRCGGTIISPRHILTAAHCLMDKCGIKVRKVSVHFGAHDICEEDWVATHLVRPSRFIFHPGYNPLTDDNDIAILLLKRDITFGPKVWIISLPPEEATNDCPVETEFENLIDAARDKCNAETSEEEYYYEYEETYEYYDDDFDEESDQRYDLEDFSSVFNSSSFHKFTLDDEYSEDIDNEIEYDYEYSDNCTTFYDGKWASIAGWGATYKFDGSCILRHARKKIYPNHHSLCLDESDYVMERDKICAYNPNWSSDACQGDSGSGLIVLSEVGPVLVGVVSYGWECGDNRSPGVYSRVQFFRQWILDIILAK